jgi:hypothetical protein
VPTGGSNVAIRLGASKAAQIIAVRRSDAGVVLSHQVRNEAPELQRVRHALRFQLLRRKGADRDRHVLKAFRAPLRGDDDVGDPALLLGGGIRLLLPLGGRSRGRRRRRLRAGRRGSADYRCKIRDRSEQEPSAHCLLLVVPPSTVDLSGQL